MSRLYIAVLLLIVPSSLAAQEAFPPLRSGLKVGQKIRVLVDAPCATERCPTELVKGKILELAAASLVVDDGRQQRELAAVDVRYVERPKDRIWNGVLVGFGVGFGAGFLSVIADDCGSQGCLFGGPSVAAAVGLLAGGIGAGVGAISDALISRERVVFVRPAMPRRATLVTPVIGAHSGGVRFTVQF